MGVLEKGMALLNIFSVRAAPMTFGELLRESGLPKATLHRILSTLSRERLVRYDAHTRSYQLGFRLLELAHEVWSNFDLRLAAQDKLTALRDQLRETVQLAVLDGEQLVLIASEEAGRPPFSRSKVGMHLPLHTTAAGKAILASMDLARRRLAVYSVSSAEELPAFWETLLNELDIIRARGYAIEPNEQGTERTCVAAPVLDIEGRPVAALSVSVPQSRVSGAQIHGLSAAVIGAAREVSHHAGGQGVSLKAPEGPHQIVSPEVSCVQQIASLLGEGPVWSSLDNALYWVDILSPAVHRFDPASGVGVQAMLGAMVSAAIPKASGGLLVATPGGLMNFDFSTRALSAFCHPERDRAGNRYNDAKCDRMGRLWIGTLDMAAAPKRGRLHRVDPDGRSWLMDEGFDVANGMGWSPDNRKMYFIDSGKRTIYVYDFELASGGISNRRALVTLDADDGKPDGMTVDEQGRLWVAIWDAWRLSCYSPEGVELQRISMPVPRPTSCCFGGPNLDTLYVSSASVRLGTAALEAVPLSGSLFAIKLAGLRGLPDTVFAA